MTYNTSADEIQCGFGKNIPELEQIAELHSILKPEIVRGKVSNDYLALIDFITSYAKQREEVEFKRGMFEQAQATFEKWHWYKKERGGTQDFDVFLSGQLDSRSYELSAIQKEKEQINGE